jgi:hypothetical protein
MSLCSPSLVQVSSNARFGLSTTIDEASMIGLEMQSFIEMYAGIRCIVIL